VDKECAHPPNIATTNTSQSAANNTVQSGTITMTGMTGG